MKLQREILAACFILFGAINGANGQVDTTKKQKQINSVDVNRGKNQITITYLDGSSEIMTEQEAIKRQLIHNGGYGNQQTGNEAGKKIELRKKGFDSPKPVFVLDGKEISEDEMAKIDPNTIESINVLKSKTATNKYGVKGKNGVVEITMKGFSIKTDDPSIDYSSPSTLKKLINAGPNDVVESFIVAGQDEMENSIKIDNVGQSFTDQAIKFLLSLKPGNTFMIEKIMVKRDGVLTKLPAVVHTVNK